MDNKPQPSLNGRHLIGIFFEFLATLSLPAILLKLLLLHTLPWYVVILIIFLPFLSLLYCITVNGRIRQIGSALPDVQYNPIFPILFRYDPEPRRHYRFKDIDGLKKILKANDVLLRRQANFIDGLILGQTTYFTHAGIYCGGEDAKRSSWKGMVIDAIGARGVGHSPLEDFVKCDDIAVVRFSTDFVDTEDWKKKDKKMDDYYITENFGLGFLHKLLYPPPGSVFSDKTPLIRVDTLIDQDTAATSSPTLQQLGQQERAMFDQLKSDYSKQPVVVDKDNVDKFMSNILDIGHDYWGRSYDYEFDFSNQVTVSCVEFVWDCYKALYPLHQIRRKITYYFKLIRTRVLVPDFFLTSEFFVLQYGGSHSQKAKTSMQLYQLVQKRHIRFWRFVAGIVVSQVLLLTAIFFLFYTSCKR